MANDISRDVNELTEEYLKFFNLHGSDRYKLKSIIPWMGIMVKMNSKEEKVSQSFLPQKGEVWTCNFGVNVGSELNGIRPCIIIQNNKGNECSPCSIVMPISNHEVRQPTQVEMTGKLFKELEDSISGVALGEKIKEVSKARLGRKIGTLNWWGLRKINKALKVSLDL